MTTPKAPMVLPWALTLKFAAAGTLLLVPAAVFFGGTAAATAALAGLAPSLFGSLLSSQGNASLASGLVLLALVLQSLWPDTPTGWVIALALACAAGAEAALTGGRSMVMALYAWLMLVLLPTAPAPPQLFRWWPQARSGVCWRHGVWGLLARPQDQKPAGPLDWE